MLFGLLPQQVANALGIGPVSAGDGAEVSPYGSTINIASGPTVPFAPGGKFGAELALTVGSKVMVTKSAKGRTPADDDGASWIHSADSSVEA